ncbi:hypothetical protein LCGC14_2029370 [marine sediment metagenome]|uniref:SpoVT-AbrB domain-containing protein n=1 Tax=marine sediment metagenome TaxID=412755 RepID=A0A0F8XJP2_9ZZZZ
MTQFLGERTLNRNRKNSNTGMLLIPAAYKNLTGIDFKTKVKIYLIDNRDLLIRPVKENDGE